MTVDGIFIWIAEEDVPRLEALGPGALILWLKLYPDAFRAGKFHARLPNGVDGVALQVLADAEEVTLADNGMRYRHAGVDRARAAKGAQPSSAGKASAEARKAATGTAQPTRSPNAPNGAQRRSRRSGKATSPRTAFNGVNDTETDTETDTEKPATTVLDGGEHQRAVDSGVDDSHWDDWVEDPPGSGRLINRLTGEVDAYAPVGAFDGAVA